MDSNGQEFSGWTRTVLGTIIVPFTEKVFGDHNYEVLTSSRNGIQRQSEHFAGKQRHDTDGYNIIPRGYCTYRNRSDDGLFTFNMNNIVDEGIVSKFYPVFTFQNANSTFMIEYLNGSPRVRAKLSVLAVGTSQVVLSFETLKETSFYLPTFEEQNRIAALLSTLNERIEKQRLLIEHLKKYKRGVITSILKQKIRFNAGVEKYPEWSTIRLDELGFFFGGLSGKTKEDFEHGDSKFITYLNVFRNTFASEEGVTLVDVKPNEKQNAIQYGDILFTQSSETVEEVGMSSVWIHQSTPYLNSFCMALRPYSLENINPRYIGYVLRSEQVRLQIMKEGQGISRINLASSRIGGVTLPMPCLEEQNSIVKFMDGIEATEDFHSQLLLQMQLLKASLLQKLFI